MKSLFVSIIALTISSTSFAAYDPNTYELNQTPSGTACVDCDYQQINPEIIQIIREMNQIQVADANSKAVSSVNDAMNFANKCDSFASDAEMGAWGSIIVKEMRRSRPEYLYKGTSDLKAVCRNYDRLSDAGKEAVWVMILNAMAHLESSCQKTITAKGPNGSLIGLLQLHVGAEQKYAKNCRRGDGNSAEGTFRCGLSMLNAQLAKRNAVFARESYWDVLRPQARSQKFKKVQKAVSNLSICK